MGRWDSNGLPIAWGNWAALVLLAIMNPESRVRGKSLSLLSWAVLGFLLSPQPAQAGATRQISQYGITWTFDREYEYGQFVNGDYWVVGPATVAAIDPAAELYHQVYGASVRDVTINGSMINPKNLIPAPDESLQAFDQRIGSWAPALLIKAPVTLQPNQSLITVKSWKLEDAGCPAWNTTVLSPRPVSRSAAVLTCLGAPPAEPMFRPGYCGDNKIHHKLRDMNLSLLPNLAPVTQTPAFSSFGMSRFWGPDIPCGWLGDYMHPSENLPHYGREIATAANNVALALLLDETTMISSYGYPINWKQQLAIRLIQFGIDSYAICENGGGWGWVGGGIGQGRKWPVLFAGLALDYAAYKNIGITYGANKNHIYFMEDAQKFYTTQTDIDRFASPKNVVTRTNCRVDPSDPQIITDDNNGVWYIADDGVSEIPARDLRTNYDYWLVWDYGSVHEEYARINNVNPDGRGNNVLLLRDPVTPGANKKARVQLFPQGRLGLPDWGERHMNIPSNDWYSRGYRGCCTANSLAGAQLCALALKTRDGQIPAKQLWNWPVFFDYMDMYMKETFSASWHRQSSVFAGNMWDTYRKDYGPIWPEKSIIYGDVSGDKAVSAYDAALTAQAVVGLIAFTTDQAKAADVSGDTAVSAYDAALIAQKAVGLIERFPVE